MSSAVEEAQEQARPRTANWLTRRIQSSRQFIHDVRLEMKKVTWPTREDVYSTTLVTILVVFFFGYFLWGTNRALSYLVEGLISKFSK